MAERTPLEILRALEREAADSERALDEAMARVLAMSPAQREREVADAGFDIDEIYADADAFYERMLAAEESPAAGQPVPASDFAPSSGALPSSDENDGDAGVVPIARARRVRRWTWALAAGFALVATSVAALEGKAVVATFKGPELSPTLPGGELAEHLPPAPVRAPPPKTRAERAEEMRDNAEKICDLLALWDDCRQWLDRARELDPAGEEGERVKRLRWEIKVRPWEGNAKTGIHPRKM